MAEQKPVMAVMGAGTMGSGIAIVCARAGFKTYLLENQAENLAKGVKLIDRFFDKSVQKGKLAADEKDRIMK